MQAILALEDGRIFRGQGYGHPGECQGEVVFNTPLTGYQEIATDPSYAGQIVVLPNPQIGNYGTNQADNEAAKPYIESGQLKPLAIVDTKRSRHLPNVATLPELGYDFVARAWLGMFAPKGIPQDIALRMNKEVGKVLANPELQQKLRTEQAIEIAPNSIEEFAAFVRADSDVAATQLRAAGIRLD